jgi:ubiquinone/menaquinone biosynthesis C-methylase UbiE
LSNFADKLRRGVLPTPEEWEEHLIETHARDPRMTPEAFAGYRTTEGLNSYEILVEALPADAQKILDLACGDGHLISYLLPKLGPSSEVTGVDISAVGLELARQDIRDQRVRFQEARAQRLPLADSSQDAVLCHMAIMLMSPLAPVLSEIRRVLKPDGIFAAVVPGRETRGLYKEFQRLIGLFVQAHLPRFMDLRNERETDIEKLLGREMRVEKYQLQCEVPLEGLWEYLASIYSISILSESVQWELKDEIMAVGKDHVSPSGSVSFEVPIQRLSLV